MIVTIDGPSGTGKSTAARSLAKRLGILYLDTGAMYRAIGLKALRRGVNLTDRKGLMKLAQVSKITFRERPTGSIRVLLDGTDVTRAIRRPEISEAASRVAVVSEVRKALVTQQRVIGKKHSLVAEGRDTGTVVFPKASLKVFLTADPRERAKRRLNDLKAAGHSATLKEVLRDLKRRDLRDRQRTHSPLRPAKEAIQLDNTGLQSSEVLDTLCAYVTRARSGKSRVD